MANYNLTQTGAEVQSLLDTVAAGYIYMGVADLTTTPDTTNPNVCYLLKAVGTYTNFGNIQHASGIGIALWNGSAWSYQNVPSAAVVATDATPTEGSTNPVQSGGVYNELSEIAKDRADIDYGLTAGYLLAYVSGNSSYTESYSNGVLHIDKTGNTNTTFRIKLKGLKLAGTYTIKFSSNKAVSADTAYLDNGNTHLETGTLTNNECTFSSFSYDGTYELGLSFGMRYNISSQDFSVTIKQEGVSGLAVVADDISERVEILEEGGILDKIVSDTNVFVGKGAGKNNTPAEGNDNGHYNTALGERAMEYNTLGDHSTAVGFCALNKNTSGRNNTAIGEDALYENLTGGQNVAVGQHAGQNSTGGYNVFIGSNVARHLASGNLNVIIGAEAYNSDGQTGCNSAILIGPYASNTGNYDSVIVINGETPTAAKEIRIGKSDFSAFIIGNKRLNFNQDGTVTWTDVTP